MPNISLLEPQVIRDVVQKLDRPENLVLSNKLPTTDWPFPVMNWDIIKGSRMIAKPNVPNSEAHIVPRLGVSSQSASFVYLREKKVFEPTTLHWLRAPGTTDNTRRAEEAVLREVTDLNQRFDNFVEWMCWRMLTGTLSLDYDDVQANVDYQIPGSHKPTSFTSWASASFAQITANVKAWKRLIARDARVPATDAYLTEVSMDYIFAAASAAGTNVLSDRMKDQYYTTGTLPAFVGLNWTTVESYYDTDAGVPTLFVPDDALVIANLTDGRPAEIVNGPTADDEAPEGWTGKFSKTWKEKDPSARQFLLELNTLPILRRPEQVVYVADLTP